MRHNLPAVQEHFETPGRDRDLDAEVLAVALLEVLSALDESLVGPGAAPPTAITLNLRRAMSIPMLVQETDALKISPLGLKGEFEPVTGIAWTSSDTNVVTVEVAADGLSAVATSVGPGKATVNVTGVNAAGETLTASQDYDVTEPAVGLNLTAGSPQPIPAAAPPPAPAPAPGA